MGSEINKLLIFGSTGLLGTALEKVCQEKKISSVALSHEDFEVTDKSKLEEKVLQYKPDVVVNATAMIGISACEKDPETTFDINAFSALNLARICKKGDIVLVQPSSHAVFDGKDMKPYIETDRTNPINVYGISKLASEFFVRNTLVPHYIVRFPTLFGQRRNSALGFVDKMIERMKQGKELRIADDRIDSPTYSIHASEKIISLIQDNHSFGTYHIANKGSPSYYEFIFKLADKIGFTGKIHRAKDKDFPAPAPNPLKVNLTSNKIPDMLDWRDALNEYVKSEGIKC